jgi:hypothetical protein
MPDLAHSLLGHDLGHLRIVAELWGIPLRSTDLHAAIDELAAALVDEQVAVEILASLSPESRSALMALAQAGGRIPWASFIRQFGDVRDIGAGKRDREKPYLNPSTPAEALFYRAFLARAFFDTEAGPQEFGYVPDEWVPLILQHQPRPSEGAPEPLGRLATRPERAHVRLASDRILDDATTFLAALRGGHAAKPDPFLQALLQAAGILKNHSLQAEKAKIFLESSRSAALKTLADAWRVSEQLNELRLIPGLICEGAWSNQPRRTRAFVLGLLDAIPTQAWWSIHALTTEVKLSFPDFQRPAGDYDSWFIKSAEDGRYLRGFAAWDDVDGALIRYLIAHVMHRLGMLDLASPVEGAEATAFRMLDARTQQTRFQNAESGTLHLTSQGRIAASPQVSRAVRYQLSRFCEWDDETADEYRYHLTPGSLTRAREQGLKIEHLIAVLAKHSDAGIPPALVDALKRWEVSGTEARAESQIVLRVSKPEILEKLRKSKAAKYLGEALGPTAVIVKGGAIQKVAEVMTELGFLLEDETDLKT